VISQDVHGNIRVWDTTNMNENILKFEGRVTTPPPRKPPPRAFAVR
jgi:hypothetical protein